MNEKYEDPFLNKEIESEPSSKKDSEPKKNFWDKFTVEIEVKTMRKIGLYIAGFVAVAALMWVGWTYLPDLIRSISIDDNNIPINDPESTETTTQDNTTYNNFDIPLSTNSNISTIVRMANLKTVVPSRARIEVMTHIVVANDSLFKIAELYDLNPTSILWGNREALGDDFRTISVDKELNILPVDGVYHKYRTSESLEDISKEYYVTVEDIINYPGNNIDPYEFDIENPGIADNTWLIIPGGEDEVVDWGPPAISRTNPAVASNYGPGACGYVYEGAVGSLNFYWPSTERWISGYDWNPPLHNAIDIGGYANASILASDDGVVVYAGWSNSGYGNLVVIDHGSGWQTIYAHLAGVSVSCGQSVWRGNVIGGMGTTGNSSGVHLHFEISSSLYGKVNPWLFLVDAP